MAVNLTNVSLNIKDGEFVSLVGKSGCGKSTLLEEIFKEKKTDSCALMFQNPEKQLFASSVIEDVMYGPKNIKDPEARRSAESALDLVGIDQSFYEQDPLKLSGGQKRKVALAGILAMQRKIVLFDEPTAGLDGKSANEIMKSIHALNKQGTTVIVATHDCDVALKYSDRIVVLNEGAVVFDGSPSSCIECSEKLEPYGFELSEYYKLCKQLYNKKLTTQLFFDSSEELAEQILVKKTLAIQ